MAKAKKKDKLIMKADGFRIVAKAGGTEAELFIYGDIGESWYGESVSAKEFVDALAGLDVDRIKTRISSYGGSVKDGIAIHNAIRRHPAANEIFIDSVAASSASLIAMAGDTVYMSANALFMVHAPWSYTVGNSAEMREAADVLDTYAEAMASSYARKSGKTHAEALELLTDGVDHYFTAEQAKENGFVDEVLDEVEVEEQDDASAQIRSALIQSRFGEGALGFIGRDLPAIAASMKIQPGQQTSRKGNDMAKVDAKAKVKDKADETVVVDASQAKADVQAAEKQRRSDVRERFAQFKDGPGVQAVLDSCLDDMDCTPSMAGEKLLAHLGTQSKPVAAVVTVEMGQDASEKFSKGAVASLMQRSGQQDQEQANAGSEVRGMTLRDMAMRSLILGGVSQGKIQMLDNYELFKMAVRPAMFGGHTTSDFPNILSNVARKFMLIGHEQADETWNRWARVVNLSDFKTHDMVGLSEFDNLDEVHEGGEYKHGSFDDYKEQIKLAKYGKMFTLTWEAMINDDLGAMTDIPRRMGLAAARKVGDLVYAVLTSNPTMRDGTALFHADHNNLVASGTAPTTVAVDAIRTLMGTQTGEKGVANLNISPVHMIVPKALEGRGKVVRDSENRVEVSSSNETVPNTVKGTFDVVPEARLDTASAVQWYMAANANIVDTINVGFLNGQETPELEETMDFSVDGQQWKIRQVAQAKAADWRGLAKNNGA